MASHNPPHFLRGPETSLDERVTRARQALAGAKTEEAAMIALSDADLATLRVVEADYFHHPGPAGSLRARIARAHAHLARHWKQQMLSTVQATPELVAGWATETLVECLPGLTDFRADWGGQYRISQLSTVDEQPGGGALFEVTTAQGLDPRRFRVRVAVDEAG